MRMFELLRSRRGVSPVLSSLLLTVVAVGAMAVATTATYMITGSLRESMSERMIIEDVWFSNVTGSIHIYVRNIGKVAIHISNVYTNHTAQSFLKPFDLEISEHRWLNITNSWVSDSLYFVDIVTTRGTHVGGYYKAP